MIPWGRGREGDSRYHHAFTATVRVAASSKPCHVGQPAGHRTHAEVVPSRTQEGLRHRARDCLHSYQQLSRPA